jgi:hypothetical protein
MLEMKNAKKYDCFPVLKVGVITGDLDSELIK